MSVNEAHIHDVQITRESPLGLKAANPILTGLP